MKLLAAIALDIVLQDGLGKISFDRLNYLDRLSQRKNAP
jgi:hypothetical protein